MSAIPPSQLQGHLKGSFVPARRKLGGWEGAENTHLVSKINTWGWREDPLQIPYFPPPPPNPSTYPQDVGRDDSLSPIEKPHLKIDYTIKMAEGRRQRDLESWLEGPPRRGPLLPKTLHWEVTGYPQGIWQTKEWLLRGRTTIGVFLLSQKVT